jgi:hypothetical protein
MKAGKFSKISCGADAGPPGNIQANQQPILIRCGFKCSKASASGRREYRRGTLPGTADASAGSITLEASAIAIHGWKQKKLPAYRTLLASVLLSGWIRRSAPTLLSG